MQSEENANFIFPKTPTKREIIEKC